MISSDEATYFLNIAVIGGTLLALSFVTLSFFLGDMLKRFEVTALPVFRSRDVAELGALHGILSLPESLTDKDLMDGDPLVVFMAFSVAVTWIFFLIPLAVGLTVAWVGTKLWILAAEMCALVICWTFSFLVRNKKINELKPYLTREELLWPYLGVIVLALYAISAGVLVITGLCTIVPATTHLAVWNRWGVSNEHAAMFLMKAVCIVSLLLGTYTTNKDMFIFFKSVAAERMRTRWLELFMRERYGILEQRVRDAKARIPLESLEHDDLEWRWNKGCPLTSAHELFGDAGKAGLQQLWAELKEGRSGVPTWLLDVPTIAKWEAELVQVLKKYELAGNQGPNIS